MYLLGAMTSRAHGALLRNLARARKLEKSGPRKLEESGDRVLARRLRDE